MLHRYKDFAAKNGVHGHERLHLIGKKIKAGFRSNLYTASETYF